jgi:tetratricopeptide (TPR) repeat protein
MDSMFIDILKELIEKQGRESLLSHAKCKPLLADFTHNEYKKESRLLLTALEAGVSKAINTTEELDICIKQQVRMLHEEYFIDSETAADVVDMLVLVLKGEQESETSQDTVCSKCGKELQKEWKVCPYCSTQVAQVAKTKAPLNDANIKKENDTNEEKAWQLYNMAAEYIKDNLDIAFTKVNELIRLYPNFFKSYLLRGILYRDNEQYDKVISDIDTSIMYNPKDAEAYCIRGGTYCLLGQKNQGIKDLEYGISLGATPDWARQALQKYRGY